MNIRTALLAGLTAACLWSAGHAAAEESTQLAQIKARVSEARQQSSGPFAEFAGVYDILKSCRPPERLDPTLGAQWLIAKSVFRFEGGPEFSGAQQEDALLATLHQGVHR